ncbi:FabD/lysophospholipase-like protein [Choiromyces venosus 120613-1]|uniref:Lysophospholipase n=1 Tax=Choiromyces venosus 120613-1 TaxID=1336337 RepID=A0A3N4J7B1_9PEZI|nr:FabD/lysophospholipase-like protein [Choiromyces venosus 120613-1]
MYNSTKAGLGALLTAGVVVAFYQTQIRRWILAERTTSGGTTVGSSGKPKKDDSDKRDKEKSKTDEDDKKEKKGIFSAIQGTFEQLIAEQTAKKDPKPIPEEDLRDKGIGVVQAYEEGRPNQRDASTDTQWLTFSDKLLAAKESILSIDWPKLTNLTNVFPDWATGLPEWVTKLQRELNMEPGSLADEIWSEAQDPTVNPEVGKDAHVRLGTDLCEDEQCFLASRKAFTKRGLAKYLDIPESEIHDDDVPIIATTGSGGGLRAMIAGTGYYQALTEAGLYNCTTYTAGVSGSCWLQALYLTSLGKCSFDRVMEHLKTRINVHIAYPPKALELVTSAPTNKYLLRGVVERLKTGYSSFSLVDLYGLLLGARLLVPSNELTLDDNDLKLSSQRRFLENGEQPLPLYTAVRHEIPFMDGENEKGEPISEELKEKASKQHESWFQWFEATPYELYCEELEAGIPTWAMGRRFENGVNVSREVPEMKLPLLFGIFGSAFCATLSHYYQEIRPFVTSVSLFLSLDKMVLDRNNDLSKVHPIDPCSIPNFVKGLKGSLPSTCPESLFETESIKLMDAGMSNNLACYPLLRPGRSIDILIAFDSSAEIQTANWIGYAEGYAKQRKIQGWPIAIGWPKGDKQAQQELEDAQAHSVKEAHEKLEAQREASEAEKEKPLSQRIEEREKKNALGYCTVWVGSKEERDSDDEPPPSKAVEDDWELMKPNAGITVVYFPLIPNEKVPGVDPEICPYLSTWNFEWTPEQIDQTVALAKANFQEGAEKLKRTVRAVYERKKKLRLEMEEKMIEMREKREEERHEENRRTHGIHDHFS